MAGHEITTILGGSRGVPPLMIRDHGAWEAQVAAEKRAKADEEIKTLVAGIERGEQERKYARPPSAEEQKRSLDRIEAEARERREGPGRVAAMLDAQETILRAMMAEAPEPP